MFNMDEGAKRALEIYKEKMYYYDFSYKNAFTPEQRKMIDECAFRLRAIAQEYAELGAFAIGKTSNEEIIKSIENYLSL